MTLLRLHPFLEILDGIQSGILRHEGFGELRLEGTAAAEVLVDGVNQRILVFDQQAMQGTQVGHTLRMGRVAVLPVGCMLVFITLPELGGYQQIDSCGLIHGVLPENLIAKLSLSRTMSDNDS